MGTKQALSSKPALFLLIITLISFSNALVDDVAKSLLEPQGKDPNSLSTYVVFVEKPTSSNLLSHTEWYESFLPDKLSSSSDRQERIIHSYRNVASGFAAKLTTQEVEAMKEKQGFISARVAKVYTLHTTHSPAFLGLHQNLGLWNQSELGKGVIIGVLDTGVTPLHPSFSDKGMPPPPAKWRGKCEFKAGCNNKLIGARNFAQDSQGLPPIDDEGHGTHTSSTAAGNFVEGASVFGNANGTAAGMAPMAHLAMYKVCGDGCFETDILAGMDAAIEDGVDVLSLSLGGESTPFFNDPLSVAAFAAVRRGMFVSCSAGNSGPDYFTLSNEAPWILTVGASTIDRRIVATAMIGNGKQYDGESLFQPKSFPSTTLFPLVYAGASGNKTIGFCAPGSLKSLDVKGKVVLCDRGGGFGRIEKGQEVKDNGGVGMILANAEPDGFSTLADPHVLPATHVSYQAGVGIKLYINSTTTPKATILFKGTQLGDKTAPAMTSFSSRGPNLQSPGILKPDITGPGVSILAAWPVSVDNNTNAKATFNIVSGTSMSCPHLSGIAALLKSSHPDWSPAAIKSAIMTTADSTNRQGRPIIDETNNPADIFATGSGHVNPSKANDPGLVYDIRPDDYIPYLCGLNYTDSQVSLIVQHQANCSGASRIPEAELNYPSFSLVMTGNSSQTYTRTVTNVGPFSSLYSYELSVPKGVGVSITPTKLSFSAVNQKASYKVTFSKGLTTDLEFSQGYIRWFSTQHSVTSPIVVIFDDEGDSE